VEDADAHVAVIIIDDEFCCGADDTLTEELADDA
jgi:hypothetical protein